MRCVFDAAVSRYPISRWCGLQCTLQLQHTHMKYTICSENIRDRKRERAIFNVCIIQRTLTDCLTFFGGTSHFLLLSLSLSLWMQQRTHVTNQNAVNFNQTISQILTNQPNHIKTKSTLRYGPNTKTHRHCYSKDGFNGRMKKCRKCQACFPRCLCFGNWKGWRAGAFFWLAAAAAACMCVCV